MITVRQLERLWEAKFISRMSRLLLEMRPESSPRLIQDLSKPTPAAALAILRLDELSQSYTPFCSRMIRTLLASQEADGGFGDAITTALAIRALSCSNGHGEAIDRALDYLTNLQKDDGSWPATPIRRLPGDAFTTAAVLFYLADHEPFAHRAAFAFHENELESDTLKLCKSRRPRRHQSEKREPALVWS